MNNITRFPEAAGAAPANATVMRSREQAYVVTDFGRGIADAFQALGRTLARLKEITEEAMQCRSWPCSASKCSPRAG